MQNFPIIKVGAQLASLALLVTVGTGCVAVAKTAEAAAPVKAPQSETTLQRLYRGTTVCTAPDGKNCGTDHWNLFLHKDGSRVMQVTSETARAGEVRHATIVIEADGVIHEAFMHNRSKTEALGSSYVLQTKDGIDQAVHNGKGLKTHSNGIELSSVASQNSGVASSIGTGPAVTDGLHFFNYDTEKAGDQPREVYWMGGSFGGTMAGTFRSTKYTLLGEEAIPMPEGYDIMTEHFRMASGSEIWLTKGSRIVVRADVRFGPGPGLRYELTELKVTPLGPQKESAH